MTMGPCPRCGAQLPIPRPGQPLFCTACGTLLEAQQQPPQQQPPQPPPQQQQQQPRPSSASPAALSGPFPGPGPGPGPGPAAEPRYWLSRGGQSYGPFPLGELGAMAADGRLGPEDGLCPEGGQAWERAAEVPGVFASALGYPPGMPGLPSGAPGYAPGAPGYPPGVPGFPSGAPGYAAGVPGVFPGQAGPPREGGIRLHLSRAFAWDLRSMKVTSQEAAVLERQGTGSEALQKFLVWRRSILLYVIAPTALSALLALLGLITLEWSSFTGFGVLVQLLWAASLVALPVAAILASRCWFDAPRSRRLMTLAWAFSFLLPIGISLFPARWVFEMGSAPKEAQVAASFLVGIIYFLNLLPLVLSLMPGILRVSIRVKALLPESIMPGWFTMAAAPFYSLLLLVAFVLVLQIAGDAVLLVALFGLVVAPLVFVLRGRLFVRPILTEAQRKGFAAVQLTYAVVVGVSVSLLLVFFLTGKVGEVPIVGDEGASLVTYGKFFWQLFKFVAEFTGRSLFITAVAVDYFLMMNLSVWQNVRNVEASDHAASYDALMGSLGQVLAAKGHASQDPR